MKSFSSALVLSAAALTLLATAACGDDSETSSSAGGGGSSSSTSTSTSTSSSSPTTGTSTSTSTSSSSDGGGTPSSSSSSGDGGSTGSTGSGGEGGGNINPGDLDCTAPSGELPALTTQEAFSVSGTPLQLRQVPGDDATFYVALKDGRIVVVRDGVELETPFLDVRTRVEDGGEQGFLGFVFHPDYAANGRFFVHYTETGTGDTYVAEYSRSDNPDVANPEEVGLVVDAPGYDSNHNGGAIEIGPDGALWVSVGDGGGGDDYQCLAQNLDARAGKILRADISTPAYGPASGNYPGADAYVFDIGLRNPWRMSFDGCTGDLWIADVGQGAREEINVQELGSEPRDYGWSAREGFNAFNSGCPSTPAPYAEPVLDYPREDGSSVTGGFVYRGSAIPALRGAYVFGDYGSGRVWLTRWAPGDATPATKTDLFSGVNGLVAFGQDNVGEVYVLEGGGSVRRIVAQ